MSGPGAGRPTPTGVAIAIPAYQAAASVADVARRARAQVETVLVIDDGSRDGTAEAARQTGAEVLVLPHNGGKGAALRAAFDTLFGRGFEAVLTLDADGQHLPEEVPKLLARRGDADLVLGGRHHRFAEMGTVRRVSNRWSARVIGGVAGLSLPDAQTGFRLYGRQLIEATGFPEHRFDAESAVLVRAGRLGFRVLTEPVELGPVDGRSTSHYRGLVDGLRIARSVTRARFERLRGKREG